MSDDIKQLIKIFFETRYEKGLIPETAADALSKNDDLYIWIAEAFDNTLPGQWSEKMSEDAKKETEKLLDELKYDSYLVPRLTQELLEAERAKEFVKLVTDLSDAIEDHLNERLAVEVNHFAAEYYKSCLLSETLVEQLKNNQQLRNYLDICLEKLEKEIINTSSRADVQEIASKITNQYRSDGWIDKLLEQMLQKETKKE